MRKQRFRHSIIETVKKFQTTIPVIESESDQEKDSGLFPSKEKLLWM